MHSQKQSAHWAVDVTAQLVPCWSNSWLKRNFWLVWELWKSGNLVTTSSWEPWDINTKVTEHEVMIYSGVSYFFWECVLQISTYTSIILSTFSHMYHPTACSVVENQFNFNDPCQCYTIHKYINRSQLNLIKIHTLQSWKHSSVFYIKYCKTGKF